MGRPAALSRERIVEAAAQLVVEHGAEALTARRLGDALGCDPTALYRHFANMDDLQREVGDHFLAAVDVDAAPRRDVARRRCGGSAWSLRPVQLRQPRLAALVRCRADAAWRTSCASPKRCCASSRRGGFAAAAAAAAYHSLIELTVGSAAIDADRSAAEPAARSRRRTYRDWRRDYARCSTARSSPHAVAVAGHLYEGSADDRFDGCARPCCS